MLSEPRWERGYGSICDVDFFKTINDTYGHALGRNQVRA